MAEGLRLRGHSVTFVVSDTMVPFVRERSFECVGRPPFDGGPGTITAESPVVVGVMQAITELRPDLVIHDFTEPAAVVAACRIGVTAIPHATGPCTPQRRSEFAAGVHAAMSIVPHRRSPSPRAIIDPCPDFLQHRAVAAFGQRIAVSALDQSFSCPRPTEVRSQIYVTVGTGDAGRSAGMVKTVIEALVRFQVPIVLSLGPVLADDRQLQSWLEQATADDIEVVEYAHHPDVMPSTDIVVCHGGSQTIVHAAAAGAWVVALPSVSDQFHTARAMHTTGLGLWHFGDRVGVDRVARSVHLLRSRDRARHYPVWVRDQLLRMPAPAAAATRVEELCLRR